MRAFAWWGLVVAGCKGADGLPGVDGRDGADGPPGADGVDGADGLPGAEIGRAHV